MAQNPNQYPAQNQNYGYSQQPQPYPAQNQPPQQGYQDYYYNDNSYQDEYAYVDEYRHTNLLEIAVIGFALLALLGAFFWGFNTQSARARDNQRLHHVSEVVTALDLFYKNSNTFPGDRFYPKATCSGRLNEVDYEYTLKSFLTGDRPLIDDHKYLTDEDYPSDPWGQYLNSFTESKVDRCPGVFTGTLDLENPVYPDNSKGGCNFSQSTRNGRKCYLYTTSSNGDSFQIAYYSESKNSFVIFSRIREEPIKQEIVPI